MVTINSSREHNRFFLDFTTSFFNEPLPLVHPERRKNYLLFLSYTRHKLKWRELVRKRLSLWYSQSMQSSSRGLVSRSVVWVMCPPAEYQVLVDARLRRAVVITEYMYCRSMCK